MVTLLRTNQIDKPCNILQPGDLRRRKLHTEGSLDCQNQPNMAEAVPSVHVVRCKFRAHHDSVVVKDVMEYLGELLIYFSGFHVARLKPRIETPARCKLCPAFLLEVTDPE